MRKKVELKREFQVDAELHISGLAELRAALLRELRACPELELHMEQVVRCDVASLQLLCSLQKSAEQAGKMVVFSGVPEGIGAQMAGLGLRLGLVLEPGMGR
jgi:ABC-type transporter Mla MlaB component